MTDPADVTAIHRREDREFVLAGMLTVAAIWCVYTITIPQTSAVFWPHTLLALLLAGRYVLWPRWWWAATPHSWWINRLLLLLGLLIVCIIELITRSDTATYFYLMSVEVCLAFGSPDTATRDDRSVGGWLLLVGMLALVTHLASLGWPHGLIALMREAPAYVIVIFAITLMLQQNNYRTRIENLMAELAKAHRQLQDYTARAEALAVAEERTRLAREVHDTLGHTLTALDVQLELLARLPPDQLTRRTEAIDQARTLAKQGLADVRRAVKALRPGPLEAFPLPAAIQRLVDEFQRTTGLAVVYQISGDYAALPTRLSLPLYRAAQEALTNVQRHAQAQHVAVSLSFTLREVVLRVDDDGRGGPITEGYGLRGLRERAEELGGDFSAGPRHPIGFTLGMKLPR